MVRSQVLVSDDAALPVGGLKWHTVGELLHEDSWEKPRGQSIPESPEQIKRPTEENIC